MIQNDELQHFGVKGMKWGVRKDQVTSVGRRAKQETHNFIKNQKIKQQRKAAYRNRSNMSDDEIRRMTNRINAENNLKQAISNSDSNLTRQVKTGLVNAVAGAAVAGMLTYATNPNVREAAGAVRKSIVKAAKDKVGGKK